MDEKAQVDRARVLAGLKAAMEGAEYKERLALTSRATFDKYKALIAAGFTEEQAIRIVAVSPY